jgi:hypothetical protein
MLLPTEFSDEKNIYLFLFSAELGWSANESFPSGGT